MILVSCQGSTDSQGVITGGIIPCSGLPPQAGAPHYAAGTVTVLEGGVPGTDGTPMVMAEQSVGVNQSYRFVLQPGHYILVAHFPPPANIVPQIGVDLAAGDHLNVDIPNECK